MHRWHFPEALVFVLPIRHFILLSIRLEHRRLSPFQSTNIYFAKMFVSYGTSTRAPMGFCCTGNNFTKNIKKVNIYLNEW